MAPCTAARDAALREFCAVFKVEVVGAAASLRGNLEEFLASVQSVLQGTPWRPGLAKVLVSLHQLEACVDTGVAQLESHVEPLEDPSRTRPEKRGDGSAEKPQDPELYTRWTQTAAAAPHREPTADISVSVDEAMMELLAEVLHSPRDFLLSPRAPSAGRAAEEDREYGTSRTPVPLRTPRTPSATVPLRTPRTPSATRHVLASADARLHSDLDVPLASADARLHSDLDVPLASADARLHSDLDVPLARLASADARLHSDLGIYVLTEDDPGPSTPPQCDYDPPESEAPSDDEWEDANNWQPHALEEAVATPRVNDREEVYLEYDTELTHGDLKLVRRLVGVLEDTLGAAGPRSGWGGGPHHLLAGISVLQKLVRLQRRGRFGRSPMSRRLGRLRMPLWRRFCRPATSTSADSCA